MASAAIFSSLRRAATPSLEVFLVAADLTSTALLVTLRSLSSELISSFSFNKAAEGAPFQRRNTRSLLRKVEVFAVLLESLRDEEIAKLPSAAVLCLKELYLLLYRCKFLLDYCKHSSKLWLLLHNHMISGRFHHLNQQFYTLLDVFPLNNCLDLPLDVTEQIQLLQKQSTKSKLIIDSSDELLRLKMYSFLDDFENGRTPDRTDLFIAFVEKMGIKDAKSCGMEIEFLEEQIANYEEDGDLEPSAAVVNGFLALTRYCRFLLYGFQEADEGDEVEVRVSKWKKPTKKALIGREIAEAFVKIPKDFCCPITLEMMKDPVIVWTGQTYDRESITRWIGEGHHTCPKTGQLLVHKWLVPNRALRNLIMQWCVANGIPYDPPEHGDSPSERMMPALLSKAAVEANKATVRLLVQQLMNETERGKTVAVRAIRFLAKNGKENRAYIAEAGAIPALKKLLLSQDAVTQENSVTAMLNLSIYDKNKSKIMDEQGCLESIVEVLTFGLTTEARENAAATLFSLSAVHDYKKRIADAYGAVEALAGLLRNGTPRGKKDAVTALFNLSTHVGNCMRMIESGALTSLVDALECENVDEDAAGTLALIVRQPQGAEAVGNQEKAVAALIGMMRAGSPKGKENAVAALLELCRSGGAAAADRVLKAPALAGLLQSLLFTGTKRARRKAASLARVFQRCENTTSRFAGTAVEYAYGGNSVTGRDASLAPDYTTMPFSISVQVL